MLYILLPVHNRRDITYQFLQHLKIQTYTNYHVVLLDDGSTDGTAELAKTIIPSITILKGNGTWWWAGALHEGYKWLKNNSCTENDYVLIINDDVIFKHDYLHIGVETLKQHPKTLVISTVYGIESGKQVDGGTYMDWKHWKSSLVTDSSKVNCASTRGLFIHALDFITLGGFYPKLLPHYTSDYEFTIRAHRLGFRFHIEPSLVLFVHETTSGIFHFRDETSYITFLRKLFSKKYTLQPVYLSIFVVLACPWKWKLKNLLLIWTSTLWKIVRYFFIIHYKNVKQRITQWK
ncbi:MAG: glycosyltransferase [Bacteroidetes bacterium]|nr:glycosyltransferase [Bacteroidota bacterium]